MALLIEIRERLAQTGAGVGGGGIVDLEGLDRLPADKRKLLVETAAGEGRVHLPRRRAVGVGRAVVAINTIHHPPFSLGIGGLRSRALDFVCLCLAFPGELDLRDLLALEIRLVPNLDARVDVPVDALSFAASRPADAHQ